MPEAITGKIQSLDFEIVDELQRHLVDLAQFELPEVGSIIIQEGGPNITDNSRFDLKIPLLCRNGSVVLEIEFEDLVLFLSGWSPSGSDCPISTAVPQVLEFLGVHCLPASVLDSGDIIVRDMVPIAVERCGTKKHCASMIERMLWLYHLHNCAIGLAYGVCDPLVQEELTQYLEEFFEDSRNVALLLC